VNEGKPRASAYMAGWGLVPVKWEGDRAYITMGVFWVTTLINGIMSFLGEFYEFTTSCCINALTCSYIFIASFLSYSTRECMT